MFNTKMQIDLGPTVTAPTIALHSVKGQVVAEEATARSGRSLLTTQAPTLAPAKESDYLDQLFALMTEILYAVVKLNENQSKVDASQNKVSDNFVTLSKAQLKKAEDDYKKILRAIEKAKHAGIFGKIFSGIAAGLMVVIGAVTLDPALVSMGAVMTLMMVSGAQDKLNGAIADLSPALKALILTGIAAACAVAINFASSAATAYLTESAAGEAAVAESTASRIASNMSGGQKSIGPIPGNYVGAFAQSTLIFNPFTPTIQGILEAAGVKKETAEFVGQIVGMICAIIAVIAGGKFSDSSLANKPLNETGQKLAKGAMEKAAGIFQGMYTTSSAAGGYFGIRAGFAQRDQADGVKDLGQVNGQLTIYQAFLSIFGTLMTQGNSSFAAVSKELAAMNSRWDEFVQPYKRAAEILG